MVNAVRLSPIRESGPLNGGGPPVPFLTGAKMSLSISK
jgi:hypothetical protein